jgi:hypothetical protein
MDQFIGFIAMVGFVTLTGTAVVRVGKYLVEQVLRLMGD